jgi:hypothetical protein
MLAVCAVFVHGKSQKNGDGGDGGKERVLSDEYRESRAESTETREHRKERGSLQVQFHVK